MIIGKQNIKKVLLWVGVILLTSILLFTVIDVIRIASYKKYPLHPPEKIRTSENEIYAQLVDGKDAIDWTALDGTLTFIQNEYDCSDFRLVNLIRIIYQFEERIPDSTKVKIEKTLLGFRYWMDEPGENSMCYWSENHQILFASAEYLIGQRYPNHTFYNDGLTGYQHQIKAKQRILYWLQMRLKYGFTEFYSSVYYKEDVAALLNLIDFAKEKEIRVKSETILNLLFYDVATQKLDNRFTSVSGRAYERNRKGGEACSFDGLLDFLWKDSAYVKPALLYGFKHTRYQLPEWLKLEGNDTAEVILKQQNGLDVAELSQRGFGGVDEKSMMMQWGMEAFVNPAVVRNTIQYIRKNHMFSNAFLHDFKYLDFTLVRWLRLEPLLVQWIKPQYLGTAIQQGNTYTYKTANFSMYTAQNYHPGTYADQHHVFGINMGNSFAVYHTHPAAAKSKKTASPNFMVGYGYLPHSAQHKNVNLSIYRLPGKKGWMEKNLLHFTYAYFPAHKFDSLVVSGPYAFGKKGDAYCAFIGNVPLEFADDDSTELVQHGQDTYWISEVSSQEYEGSFKSFISRIMGNTFWISAGEIHYQSRQINYSLKFKGDFKINHAIVEMEYERFNSKYMCTCRNPNHLQIQYKNETYGLKFER